MSHRTSNAVITKVSIDFDRQPTAWVFLDYGGSGQGFGGFHLGGAFMHAFVSGTCKAVGAETWEGLVGKSCRVRHDNVTVHAIGHLLREQWFAPRDTFVAMQRQGAPS